LIQALGLLPRNAISRLVGRLVSLRLPAQLQRAQIRSFARTFGIDLDEIRDPIESFACLQDFFVRELREGARPIDGAADAFVSPCDGAWGAAGRIEDGRLIQLKGRPYSLGALLGDDREAKHYEGGFFATIYLSPRDYHRFHAPCAARVARLRYLPGSLWPVNRAGVEGVDALFSQNERKCAVMAPLMRAGGESAIGVRSLPGEEARTEGLCIAAVGATMVGKVRVKFDSLSTNLPGAGVEERVYGEREPRLATGEEWGRFEFGSTLVIVTAPGILDLEIQQPGTPVRIGERIGRLLAGPYGRE
jgi:phosphatidylserine decarboxylase